MIINKKRKFLKAITYYGSIMCILLLVGCNKNVESSKVSNTSEVKESTSVVTSDNTIVIRNKKIAKVLENKAKYFNTELKKECYIKDYNSDNYLIEDENGKYQYREDGDVEKLEIDTWCQVDMDSDGNEEVLLQTRMEKVLVLTCQNGKVYCYAFPFRGMKNIKEDGSFEGSGSAADTYIGKLKFKNGNCYYDEKCALDELDDKKPIYRLNGKNITKEKAMPFIKKQDKKKNVEWHKWKNKE